MMVTFLSLFLGLVLGPQTVEIEVEAPVARVELLLDGALLGEITAPPWRLEVSLGEELAPHRLEAVAYDAEGTELDRALQWLNLPRPPAEVQLGLDGGEGGKGRSARLSWESVTGDAPPHLAVTLDGRPLPVTQPVGEEHRISVPLPPFDPAQLHFLRAEVDFSQNLTSVAELVFGGTYADEVTTDLTAVPVLLDLGTELPSLGELQGWLLRDGRPLEIVAAEQGLAEILVIRDAAAMPALDRLGIRLRRLMSAGDPARSVNGSQWLREMIPLGAEERVRFFSPHPAHQQGSARSFALFPTSPEFSQEDGGLYWLLTRARQSRPRDTPQQLADATALAGVAAAGRARRRAVLVLLGRRPEDASQLPAQLARRYLEHLQVPLRIWITARKPEPTHTAWGPARHIDTAGRLSLAAEELRYLLDRQHILWVRGSHLPQEIALAPHILGARLPRDADRDPGQDPGGLSGAVVEPGERRR